jgi:hypothetical protein
MTDQYDQRRARENQYFQERRLARMLGGDQAERAAIGRHTRQSLADVGIFPETGSESGRRRGAKTLLGLAGIALTAYLEYRKQRQAAAEADQEQEGPTQ